MGVSRIFTLATPYTSAELPTLDYEQSADLVKFAHMNHAPQELRRYDHALWTLTPEIRGTVTVAPTSVTAVATNPNTGTGYTPISHEYGVTAVDDATGQESLISTTSACTNDLALDGNYNTVTWVNTPGAAAVSVYKKINGVYGYVGAAVGTSFVDRNILPDLSDGPATANRDPFPSADNYPGCVTFDEQRTVYARTKARPNLLEESGAADLNNYNRSIPPGYDESRTYALVAQDVNAIQHVVSQKKALVILADSAIWTLPHDSGDPLPLPVRETRRGANAVRPVTVDEVLFYMSAKGSRPRTLGYTFEVDGFRGSDIGVFASHFFEKSVVKWMAWADEPYSVLFAGRDDGKLLALTWQAEQDVWGWSQLETSGMVEWGCVVHEDGIDTLYCIVQRGTGTAGDPIRRFLERMATPLWRTVEDSVYLDASRQYVGDPATLFSGMHHLEGRVVTVLADGAVIRPVTITNGGFTLAKAASKVTVGLPFEAWIRTLPPAQPGTVGREQDISQVSLSLVKTRGIAVGVGRQLPSYDLDPLSSDDEGESFYPVKTRNTEPYGSPPYLFTGEVLADVPPSTERASVSLVIRQRDPLPMCVTAVNTDLEVSGE